MGAVSEHPRWAASAADSETYRAPPGRNILEAVAEQDDTAGGMDNRRVVLPEGGQATGSVELKSLGRRVYAYLRYQRDGRTVSVYIGEAPGSSRDERLRTAWRMVQARDLIRPDP